MQTYLIERRMPGVEKSTADELRVISHKSNGVLGDLGAGVRWLHSYIIADRIYCVYESESTALIQEHARCMGIPADSISAVHHIISPATGK